MYGEITQGHVRIIVEPLHSDYFLNKIIYRSWRELLECVHWCVLDIHRTLRNAAEIRPTV